MKVIPLAYTQANWADFIKVSSDVVGRGPTRSLDSANIRPGDPFSYIAALVELRVQGTAPRDAVRQATDLLQHVSFSFMVHISDYEYSELTNIPILAVTSIEGKAAVNSRHTPDKLLFISGNLLEWQIVVPMMIDVNSCHRQLFSEIFNWFKKMNLRELFDKYTEVLTDDGLFRLELR